MRRRAGGGASAVIGIILLIVGLAWGLTGTHQVGYSNSQQNVTYHIGVGTDSGNVYIHADGSDEYFVALKGDFNPDIAQSDIDNSAGLSFVARTDTTSIELNADNGATITEAHKIEKLVFFDKNGSTMATYVTTEYTSNPNGVSVNAWSSAIWLVVLGLLLAVLGVFQVMRKRNTNFSIGGAPAYQPVPPAYPPTQPGVSYPPANPYGQAYQNPAQYPQQGGNPYQQPPQG